MSISIPPVNIKNALKNKNVFPPVVLPPFKSIKATTTCTTNPPISQHPRSGKAPLVTLPDNKAKKAETCYC
ncbi:UDP-N-acetylglucosamine pyrophosphorylase [Clostridium beijerinckii]|nr:UDP-N-acetylglucosamine pyrophosphorylase [Clostridium beijerinckii]